MAFAASATALAEPSFTKRSVLRDTIAAEQRHQQCEKERRQLISDLELLNEYDPSNASLSNQLEAAKARLDELTHVLAQVKEMKDAGRISVVHREGMTVLQLPEQILFDSGRAQLNKEGRETVDFLAVVLSGVKNHQLMVTGHTDDRPVAGSSFNSNWDLSTSRALSVLKALAKEGIEPSRLAAAGYAEHVPVAPNDTAEGRALNRRTEIVLMPFLSEVAEAPAPGPVDEGRG